MSVVWLDYLDARRRLAHAWRAEGLESFDIALRFEVDTQHVERILAQPVDPPMPGTTRDKVRTLERRVESLESALLRPPPPSEQRAPAESEFRALRLHPDPECCGCQYWSDTPTPGQHNPKCQHFKGAP